MSDGYRHTGKHTEVIVAVLPKSWDYMQGLRYPLELRLENGSKLIFNSYSDHHDFIKSRFRSGTKSN